MGRGASKPSRGRPDRARSQSSKSRRNPRRPDQRAAARGPTPLQLDPAPSGAPRTLHRDQDLWVVDKPVGWLTHSDGTGARPDLCSWLTAQALREGQALSQPLGVHQRLDVSTSGVIAFSLSAEGASALQEATQRPGKRRYLAVVEGATPPHGTITGAVPAQPKKDAETRYQRLTQGGGTEGRWSALEVTPYTGRTHQIRAHLASIGTPIRGDGRYGDPYDLRAPRALLHAYELSVGGHCFTAPVPVDLQRYLPSAYTGDAPLWQRSREGLFVPGYQDCFRLVHGEADGARGWRLDRYGDWLWAIHDEGAPVGPLPANARGVYKLEALIDRSRGQQSSPQLWRGEPAPLDHEVWEAGVRYRVRLGEQLSTGLFLDQRPQRAWLSGRSPEGHPTQAPPLQEGMRLLNTFAHAGGFSVAAACAGAETVSVDLSSRWLSYLHESLELNGLSSQGHRLCSGDVFDWLRRLVKRGERFDMIILDPPSTSVGKTKRRWSAKKDYPELVSLALPLLAPGGRLFTATNHRQISPARFVQLVGSALPSHIELERVCAPAVDFPHDGPMGVKNLIWRAKR